MLDQAIKLVEEYITKNDPSETAEKGLVVRRISQATGVSTGQFPKIPAWQKYKERKRTRSGGPRAIPLTDEMMAEVPNQIADATDPEELVSDRSCTQRPSSADRPRSWSRAAGSTDAERS